MKVFTRMRAAFGVLAAMILTLAGCGGSGGNGTVSSTAAPGCADSAGCGTTYIALTDADGDFLSYTVDVVSLTLKRSNGTVVETLPAQTRVDFAQYVDLTEFLTAASIPNGSYIEGTLKLDYSNAEVTVESNGQPVAAKVVDADGNPLGVVDVKVILDNRSRLIVAPGRPSLLTLDFNLAATNTVDLSTTPATVTARPTLVASLEPVDEKDLRVRGPLVSVDTSAGSYVVDLRPFNRRTGRNGEVTVHTTSTTAFEVNGETSTGSAGLQALEAAGAGTATIALGTLSTSDRSFTAVKVYAGSSVPGTGYDAVIGTVIARSGDELTVRGGTIVHNDSTMNSSSDDLASFDRGDIKVIVGPNTVVLKDGFGAQAQGADAISVGQLINAFGSASTSGGVTTIDATSGRVRMHLSHVIGSVVNTAAPILTVDVDAINGRRVSAFDFSGTGQSSGVDADPANYEVQTGALSLSQLAIGKLVRVFGYVTPFGAAPPDFEARSLVSYAELRAELGMSWSGGGTNAPFSSINDSGLILDLANPAIGLRHHIHIGPLVTDLNNLASSPLIAPASSGQMMFVVATPTGIRHYSDFAEFVTALNAELTASNMVNFSASGSYDQVSNTLTSNVIAAVFR